MTPPTDDRPRSRTARLSREYPPMVLVLALLAVLALILPNALRIPPQDPPQVLEYAPVPPQDNSQPNPNGNLSNLALGANSTLSEGITQRPPPPPKGTADVKTQKHCYQTRQTADPNAPPCVAFFTGDNGGATWRGVTRDEIRAVAYIDYGDYLDNQATGETAYAPGIYDVDKIPAEPCPQNTATDPTQCSFNMVRALRALENYFNGPYGFQTYNRRVHFWLQIANSSNATEQERRADAQDAFQTVQPFAAVALTSINGYVADYVDGVAARQIMTFSSSVSSEPGSFYRHEAPYSWGFWPDLEHWAQLYSSYICRRVAPFPVAHTGSGGVGVMHGKRVFGLLRTKDETHPELQRFADLVAKDLATTCGVKPVLTEQSDYSGYVLDNEDSGAWARQACTAFSQAGVTTVLYVAGTETKFSSACHQTSYYPEIVVAGDLLNDGTIAGQYQDQAVWANAWTMSFGIRLARPQIEPGYQAALTGDPNLDDYAARRAAVMYHDLFMLFQAIQVAGPRLSPSQVDAGFHAIPPKASTDPFVASCFFDPGDYTCVKDGTEMWWDPAGGTQTSSQPGCWRVVDEGKRYLPGDWPHKQTTVFANPNDPCHEAQTGSPERRT